MKAVIILGLAVLILIIGLVVWPKQEAPEQAAFSLPEKETKAVISNQEKKLIEAWITKNDLNQYGDSKDTVYAGGTPLFNEMTGKTIDRYKYILRKYPEQPWLK